MPSTPERRRHKRAADKLGISVEEYEAQLAAQEEGEIIEDDEPTGPKAGNSRKSAAPKGRKPPKAGKSELLNKASEHVSTMGAQALQLVTLRTMGPKGMLSPQEAQGIVQPVGRMVSRRVSKTVVLPNMPGDDAEDVAEIALTLVEYVLRLLAQAMNAWVHRIAGGGQQEAQPQQAPVAARAAVASEPEPEDFDPTGGPVPDVFMPGDEPPEESSAPVRNGRGPKGDASQIFDMALMAAPYSGAEE